MFSVEELEKKVAALVSQVEQSAANHHILVGSKMTFESLLAEAKKGAEVIEAVVEAIEPVQAAVTGTEAS